METLEHLICRLYQAIVKQGCEWGSVTNLIYVILTIYYNVCIRNNLIYFSFLLYSYLRCSFPPSFELMHGSLLACPAWSSRYFVLYVSILYNQLSILIVYDFMLFHIQKLPSLFSIKVKIFFIKEWWDNIQELTMLIRKYVNVEVKSWSKSELFSLHR